MIIVITLVGVALFESFRAITNSNTTEEIEDLSDWVSGIIPIGLLILIFNQFYTSLDFFAISGAIILTSIFSSFATRKWIIPFLKNRKPIHTLLIYLTAIIVFFTAAFFGEKELSPKTNYQMLQDQYQLIVEEYNSFKFETLEEIENNQIVIDSLQIELDNVDRAIETIKERREELEQSGDWRDVINDFLNG